MVSLAEDDAWRRIRNVLTPSFSTGRIKEVQITHFCYIFEVCHTGYTVYPHYLSLAFYFCLSKMYKIMTQHSSNMVSSLQPQVQNGEVIRVKE